MGKIFPPVILASNFLPSPDLLRVLTHLIAKKSVFCVAWSPDGTSLASASRDHTLKIWNAKTGKCVSTLSGHRYRQKL
jgi:WD40 repeat protein